MRKLFSFVILFALLVILSNPQFISGAKRQTGSLKPSSETAEAYLSETTWDFGKIPSNSVVSHTFWIRNVGNDTLKILKVRPG